MKKLLVCMLTLLALACLPTEPCACSVVPFGSVLSGTVTMASGALVSRAVVRAYAEASSCPLTSNRMWPDNVARNSSETGEYMLIGYQKPPADQFCLRVVARLPAPATDSVVVERMMNISPYNTDLTKSFRVDLVFPG